MAEHRGQERFPVELVHGTGHARALLLPAPRGMPACPPACTQGHASVPTQACHGLGCVPWPWQHARKHALAFAACPWGLPWPWLLHAPTLGSMPIGGCLGLGCMPWPWPWMHALPLALALDACLAHGLGCMPWPHIWSDFLKMRVFWKMRLFPHEQAGSGHPRGMPACTPCRIAPHRPALRKNWLVPFSIFVSLNSFHDFRGGFQQAVWRSERF